MIFTISVKSVELKNNTTGLLRIALDFCRKNSNVSISAIIKLRKPNKKKKKCENDLPSKRTRSKPSCPMLSACVLICRSNISWRWTGACTWWATIRSTKTVSSDCSRSNATCTCTLTITRGGRRCRIRSRKSQSFPVCDVQQ